MQDRILDAEGATQLQLGIKELEKHRKSLVDDLEHFLPVQPQIDAVDQALVAARHMLKKYGAQQAIRPRKAQ